MMALTPVSPSMPLYSKSLISSRARSDMQTWIHALSWNQPTAIYPAQHSAVSDSRAFRFHTDQHTGLRKLPLSPRVHLGWLRAKSWINLLPYGYYYALVECSRWGTCPPKYRMAFYKRADLPTCWRAPLVPCHAFPYLRERPHHWSDHNAFLAWHRYPRKSWLWHAPAGRWTNRACCLNFEGTSMYYQQYSL